MTVRFETTPVIMLWICIVSAAVALAQAGAIFDRNFTKPYVLKKTWVQNFIKFQYIFEGKQRKAKIVPLGCVPANTESGKMLLVGDQFRGHDFVFSCEEGEDGVLNYEAIACVDAYGSTMYPGEARRLSNGTVILHCNIFGGALKKVVERVAGCYFNETIYGEDEKWAEPFPANASQVGPFELSGRLMQCFRPHYSYYESHVVGCLVGRVGIMVEEFAQTKDGVYIKCVENELGSVKLVEAKAEDLACHLDNEMKAHQSQWTDDKRAAVLECNYGHIVKTKCIMGDKELPIGQEIPVTRDCIFLCHPQTNVYICDSRLEEFKIIDDVAKSNASLRTTFRL